MTRDDRQLPALTRRQLLQIAGTFPLAAAFTCGVAGRVAGAAAPQRHTVALEGMVFKPPRLSVRRGDRVEWVNKDLFPHTVTATSAAFDSHEIAAGQSWSYVAKGAGEYPYRCTLHPTMTGHLTVV